MLATDKYRALHYVLKIADRKSAIDFFKNVLGMKVSSFLTHWLSKCRVTSECLMRKAI